MPSHKHSHAHGVFALTVGMALLGAATAASAQTPVPVPLDSETTISGVGVACTGIGGTKDDPRWGAYPVRVEFANAKHEYLIGEIVTLSDGKGAPIFTVSCQGPWLLLKLPDRRPYHLDAHLTEANTSPQTAIVRAPAHGQARVVLTFPDG